MRIAVAGDHAGFAMKGDMVSHLETAGHQVLDLGPERHDPDDDYPDFADETARAVVSGRAERGILICGSGVGPASFRFSTSTTKRIPKRVLRGSRVDPSPHRRSRSVSHTHSPHLSVLTQGV